MYAFFDADTVYSAYMKHSKSCQLLIIIVIPMCSLHLRTCIVLREADEWLNNHTPVLRS